MSQSTSQVSSRGLSPWAQAHLLGIIEGYLQVSGSFTSADYANSVRIAVQYDDVRKGHAIKCPVCKMVSYNPSDISEGYCGNCRDYTTVRS